MPVIDGWRAQKYGNVPVPLNVYEYVWPWKRIPLLGLPMVPVTVCGALSMLVHVTLVPRFTVIVAGA